MCRCCRPRLVVGILRHRWARGSSLGLDSVSSPNRRDCPVLLAEWEVCCVRSCGKRGVGRHVLFPPPDLSLPLYPALQTGFTVPARGVSYTSPLTRNGTRSQAAAGLRLAVSWASLSASPLLPRPQRTRGGVWGEAGAGRR